MIVLRESAGDKTLYKIIMFKMPEIPDLELEAYDGRLQAYLYIEPFSVSIQWTNIIDFG